MSDLKKITGLVESTAVDVNRMDAMIKEISILVRDLSSKMDLLIDARTPEIVQASPQRKPVGRGKVTKTKRKTEPDEDEEPHESPAADQSTNKSNQVKPVSEKPSATPQPADNLSDKAPDLSDDESDPKAIVKKPQKAAKPIAAKTVIDEPSDEFTVKKTPAAKAKPKAAKPPAKPATFNRLTAFTHAYRVNPNRFDEYFTKDVRADVEALPELSGLTGEKLENARMRALYQSATANYPEIFDELREEFNKAE